MKAQGADRSLRRGDDLSNSLICIFNDIGKRVDPVKAAVGVALAIVSAHTLFSNPVLDGDSLCGKIEAVFSADIGVSVTAFMLACCNLLFLSRVKKPDYIAVFLSIGLSLSAVLGRSLYCFGDLSFVIGEGPYLAFSAFFFVGYGGVFYLVFATVLAGVSRFAGCDSSVPSDKGWRPILVYFLIIALCWLPYVIIMFPGQPSWDGTQELRQFFGARDPSDKHPWFMTLVLGGLYQFGMFLAGSSQGGVFAISTTQTLAMALSFAFFVYLLLKLGCPKSVRIGVVLFFALCPIFPQYAQWCIKNTLCTVFLAHFIVQILLRVLSKSDIMPKYTSWPAVTATAILSILSRHDFLFIVVPVMVAAIVFLEKRERAICAAVMGGALIFNVVWGSFLLPSLGISKGNISESLSLPLLQTTKVIEVDPNGLTTDEISALQDPCDIPISELPQYYMLSYSDLVKEHYLEFEDGELLSYLKVYLMLGLRYPSVYADVLLAHTFGYWYPAAENSEKCMPESVIVSPAMFSDRLLSSADLDQRDMSGILYDVQAQFPEARVELANVLNALSHSSLLFMPGLYYWIGLALILSLIRRDNRYVVLMVFIAVLFLICCASPVNGSIRYSLPLVFLAPVIFGLACLPDRHGCCRKKSGKLDGAQGGAGGGSEVEDAPRCGDAQDRPHRGVAQSSRGRGSGDDRRARLNEVRRGGRGSMRRMRGDHGLREIPLQELEVHTRQQRYWAVQPDNPQGCRN